jgi:SAM-dependent methyltransferase
MNISLRRFLRKLFRSPSERRHHRVGPAHLWRMKRDFQIEFLRRAGLSRGHYLLDIGCGTLRGGIPIIDYLEKGHYYGLESRPDVLKEGRRELAKARLESKQPVLIAEPDILRVRLERQFDYAWAFSVLIHMTDEILEGCIALVAGSLAPDGVFYANVNIGEAPPGNWQGFPVMYRTLDRYTALCKKNRLTLADAGSLKELGHVSGDDAQDSQRMLEIRRR